MLNAQTAPARARALGAALLCLLATGCVGPHASGGLWAQQELEQELAVFRVSDAERTAQAHAYELGIADEVLAAERARVAAALEGCPGSTRQPLTLSPGDHVRDGVRMRLAGDPGRQSAVAQVALADWWQRRALATGDERMCAASRAALGGAPPATQPTTSAAPPPVTDPTPVTVRRDPGSTPRAVPDADRLTQLSLYAAGWADAVVAPTPLPQYLAAVYGGQVGPRPQLLDLGGRRPEEVVDDLAPAYPELEPDALYVALSVP